MIGLLVKKQLCEIFKAYFYDAKHNRKRSRAGTVAYFMFFGLIMLGLLGGSFGALSALLCGPLTSAGLGWLYYIFMGVLSVTLGVFGSVFNTYSSLYAAKDNDLLFSLPISANAIMISRLLSVYLMGLMYSACVLLPAMIVYWIHSGFSFTTVFGPLVLLLDISLIDLVLSCLFGYIVAGISLKLKNRKIISALTAVLFIAGYYFFYFRFSGMINSLIQNAEQYGAQIKGSAKALYLFGAVGEGNPTAMLLWTVSCAVAAVAAWYVLHRNFLKIATSTGAVKKNDYREKKVRRKSLSSALIVRELRHFTGSTNYMLNCGLGILLLPLAGAALLWQGERFTGALSQVFGAGGAVVALCAALCMAGAMIDTAAPSVSLEGKNLWLIQSLPVSTWHVLRAKLHTQLLLGGIPMTIAALCGAIILFKLSGVSPATVVLFILLVLLFQVFLACWGLFLGVRMANTNWSNEIYPIKQSMPVFLSLFGGWILAVALAVLYLWQKNNIGTELYLLIAAIIISALSAGMLAWLKKNGAKRFSELQ